MIMLIVCFHIPNYCVCGYILGAIFDRCLTKVKGLSELRLGWIVKKFYLPRDGVHIEKESVLLRTCRIVTCKVLSRALI